MKLLLLSLVGTGVHYLQVCLGETLKPSLISPMFESKFLNTFSLALLNKVEKYREALAERDS